MFENWKVGQTGWVRLRNGKIARAIQFGDDDMPVQIQFMKGNQLALVWVDNSGCCSVIEAIEHLPDCTGFDWEPKTQASGVEIIRRERERQVKVEGWSESHDDKHDSGELAQAASCYAWHSRLEWQHKMVPDNWPFELWHWKPCEDRVKELAKAGALIAAEIDRINRKSQLDSCKPPKTHEWKVGDVEPCKKPTFEETREAIREAGGKDWDNIEDPIRFLKELRGEDNESYPDNPPNEHSSNLIDQAPNEHD